MRKSFMFLCVRFVSASVLVASILFWPTTATASVSAFDTFGPGNTYSTGSKYGNGGYYGCRGFSFVPTVSGTLENITVAIGFDCYYCEPEYRSDIRFSLYNGTAAGFGSLLESFVVTNNAAHGQSEVVTFSSILKPFLESGQTFWLCYEQVTPYRGSQSLWFFNNQGFRGSSITPFFSPTPTPGAILPAFRINVNGEVCDDSNAEMKEIPLPAPGSSWSKEAASGEILQIIWTGSHYELLYIKPGIDTHLVGICIFDHGMNKAWYWAVDQDGNGPDYFTKTQWLNVDGGWDDLDHGVPGYLDIIQHTYDVCNDKYSRIYELKIYPDDCKILGRPAISNPFWDYLTLMNHCKPKDFPRYDIEYIDPPLGPETDLLFDELVQQIQPGETLVMGEWKISSCDINQDGICDRLDYNEVTDIIDVCWENVDYNLFADRDGDSCITSNDLSYIFGNNQFPVAVCQDVIVATDTGVCMVTETTVDAGSTDPDEDPITIEQSPPAPYTLGTTDVTLVVTDDKGASDSCTAKVTVVDQEAPTIQNISASPGILWPPSHEMIAVNLDLDVFDNCPNEPTCMITSVTSNEPVNGLGDADTSPDWEFTGDLTLNLRAERSGEGYGRIYTITIECTDVAGNTSTETVDVFVPHHTE